MIRVGVHTSIAGAIENAAHHAKKLGCDTFQMFSANPRGWRTLDPTPEQCERFRVTRDRYGHRPVAIHAKYLINLASGDRALRAMSMAAFRRELQRAMALGADYLIVHPGSARDSTRSQAIKRCVSALKRAARNLPLNGLAVLIENTAGQGSAIGSSLEEVAEIIAGASGELRVGACLDTAHCFAMGYPIHTEEGLEDTISRLVAMIGLERVGVIHANDSKAPLGSRVDRHEHIGRGHMGREAFRRIVRHPKLRDIPFICETPIDRPGDDKRNLRMMRRLASNV